VPNQRSPLAGTIIVLVGASLFATLGPLSRFAYDGGMDSLAFVAWRAGLATLALAAIVGWGARRRSRPFVLLSGLTPAARRALATGVFFGLLINISVFAAFERTTVALALLGFYTYPAMIAAANVALGREPLTREVGAALGFAVVGMVLVMLGGLGGAGQVRFDALGVVLALAAAASQTVFVLASRGYREVPADQAMGTLLGVTFAATAVLSVALGGPDGLLRPLRDADLLPILLAAGILGAAIPSLMFLVGIRLVGGTRAGILMLFEPVVGVILAAILLGEALGPIQVLGGAAILVAAVILQRTPVRPGAELDEPLATPAPGGP
jgi:drug/metabolite transporter (DMT)-like permease